MTGNFRVSLGDHLHSKRRGRTSKKSAARRRTFHALGWEQLEGRLLLTVAGTITWTGGSTTSSNWSDPANWDLNRAPINGDSLVFPASAQRLANNDDIAGLSVNSIMFQGSFAPVPGGYCIGGNDLTLGAGGITDDGTPGSTIIGVVNEIDLNLDLSAAQGWSISDSSGRHHLAIDGNLANGGFTLTATGQGIIDVAGQISGSGGLAVAANAAGSAPTVELLNANTYTGETSVAGGTLIVNGSTAATSAVGVGAGGTLGGAGTVGGKITFTVGGLAGHPLPAGTLDPGPGPNLSEDTGTLSNTGGVFFEFLLAPAGASGDAQFAMQLGGTAANPTNDQLDSAGTVSLGAATLDLTSLAGAGPFNAGQQFVLIQAGAPITSTFAGLPEGSTVSDGTQNFTISYANDRVTLAALATGSLTWTGGSTTSSNWSDPANWDLNRAPINGDSLVFPASAQRPANNDDIPGLSVKSIMFQGGFDTVSGYTLRGDDLTVGGGGIADNSRYAPPPGASAGGGFSNQVDLNLVLSAAQNWSSYDHLVMNGNVDNGGFELTATGGGTFDFAGQISGGGGLAVVGNTTGSTPTVELQNANTYTGATSISLGTLIVNGSTTDASEVSVDAGATLGGTGTVGGEITFVVGGVSGSIFPAGTLDPGPGPDLSEDTGTLSNTGGVSFEFVPTAAGTSLNAQFAMQLGGTAANPANDQFDSAGTVSLGAATLDLTALAGGGPFNAGQQFVLIQAGAPITTTFAGLPAGSTVSDSAQNFTISYANDRVTLTAQPLVPTASTYLNGQAGDGTAATFVHNLYRELLGREPDAAGQAYWVSLYNQLLATGSRVPGAPSAQQTLAADFLNSTEYRQHLVEGMYTDFLHRAADAGGLAFWTAELAAGVDEKNVLAGIAASDEYFAAAGITTQSWVNALYRDLLGRTADSGGLAFWTTLTQGVPDVNVPHPSRATVAFEFLSTAEAEHKLLNGNYPEAPGSVGAPGTPAVGAYALAGITGNGWENLYFQGNLSAAAADTLFAQLQAGESYGETIAGTVDVPQYFD